jgi:ankyrin repeat protein
MAEVAKIFAEARPYFSDTVSMQWVFYKHDSEEPYPYPNIMKIHAPASTLEFYQRMDFNGKNILINQVAINDVSGLEELLLILQNSLSLPDRKAIINHQDQNGNTALVYACAKNEFDMVRLLLDAGADVNLGGTEGNPLFQAVCYGSYEVFCELIKAGADPKAVLEKFADQVEPFKWLLKNPDICLEKTLARQISRLFSAVLGKTSGSQFFASMHQDHKRYAQKIISILLSPDHKEDGPEEIQDLIKHYPPKTEDDFKDCVDFVLNTILSPRIIEMQDVNGVGFIPSKIEIQL